MPTGLTALSDSGTQRPRDEWVAARLGLGGMPLRSILDRGRARTVRPGAAGRAVPGVRDRKDHRLGNSSATVSRRRGRQADVELAVQEKHRHARGSPPRRSAGREHRPVRAGRHEAQQESEVRAERVERGRGNRGKLLMRLCEAVGRARGAVERVPVLLAARDIQEGLVDRVQRDRAGGPVGPPLTSRAKGPESPLSAPATARGSSARRWWFTSRSGTREATCSAPIVTLRTLPFGSTTLPVSGFSAASRRASGSRPTGPSKTRGTRSVAQRARDRGSRLELLDPERVVVLVRPERRVEHHRFDVVGCRIA